MAFSAAQVRTFFAKSDLLDHAVLRPLAHIRPNWEITWDADGERYHTEDESFAHDLNLAIDQIARTEPPKRYHDSEDRLAEYVATTCKWPIVKQGNRWVGANYEHILERGGTYDTRELVFAAAGRVHAALQRNQMNYDEMEQSHAHMLGAVLAILIYHRADWPDQYSD